MTRRTPIAAFLTAVAVAGVGLAARDAVPTSTAAQIRAPRPPAVEYTVDMADGNLESGRAIMVRVRHTPDPQEPHRISVERTKVYVRRGDAGPIEVTTRDRDGKVLDQWRASDPLTRSAESAHDDEARYGIPYSPDLAVVEITDTRTGAATAAKVDEAVRSFCAGSPSDEICRGIDLVSGVTLDSYDPRTLHVGESVDVPVHVHVANKGPDWAHVGGSMSVYGILDNVEFTTADDWVFRLGHLEPGSEDRTLTYTLRCTSEGDDRVFVGAQFGDGSPEAVEATPADNWWNTWFDVHCDPAP